MKRWPIILVVLLLILVVGFFAFNNYIYSQKQAEQVTNPTPEASANNPSSLPEVVPISHASFVLKLGGQVIYNDPVGAAKFTNQPIPNMILLSDIHPDHLDAATLTAISKPETVIVAPKAVADLLPQNLPGSRVVLANGEKTVQNNIEIEAIPMYNIPETPDARHTKSRGNGYLLTAEGKRIYIAGDTSVTPEMKALTNIDLAFIPMNPPFTMTVEEAAQGVAAFKPKIVYPYHYRTQSGLSDVNKFKELVAIGDPSIKVELLNFYPDQ